LDHKTSIPPGIDRSGLGSPERFIDRLNRQLRKIGVVVEKLPVKTRPSGGPPCFRVSGVSYKDWLTQASIAPETIPYRMTMPPEPNYCYDCTPTFKAEMQSVSACLFPDTRFEKVKEFDEVSIAGVGRNLDVAPDFYAVYSDLLTKRRAHD
jgi:hypothetical protein